MILCLKLYPKTKEGGASGGGEKTPEERQIGSDVPARLHQNNWSIISPSLYLVVGVVDPLFECNQFPHQCRFSIGVDLRAP
jgi:hypothetical protein